MIDIAKFDSDAVGQTVMALNMREGPKWRPGVVEVHGGLKWKRHSDL